MRGAAAVAAARYGSQAAPPGHPSGADAEDAETAPNHKDAVTSVARLLSLLFVHDDFKPAFALVLLDPVAGMFMAFPVLRRCR